MAWVASVVHHTERRARIAPTDRSMPPPVITKVMPTLTTPITAASRRMVSTLFGSANRSPAVITPDHAEQQPARRPGRGCGPRLVRSSSANRPPGWPAAAGRARVGHRRRHPVGRPVVADVRGAVRVAHAGISFHHQVEHPRLVDLRRRPFVDDDSLADHQHPVGETEDLLDLAGDHHHGHPGVGQRPDQRRRSRSGRRRRPRGSARPAAAPGTPAAASGPAAPSAGSRRRGCGRRG